MIRQEKHGKNWAVEHNLDELNEDVWFEPVQTFIENQCTAIWTNNHADVARFWVANGVVTQRMVRSAICAVLLVHRLDECWHWRRIRTDLTEEVAKTNASAKWSWVRGICCFPSKLNEARRCERQWVSYDFEKSGEDCRTSIKERSRLMAC